MTSRVKSAKPEVSYCTVRLYDPDSSRIKSTAYLNIYRHLIYEIRVNSVRSLGACRRLIHDVFDSEIYKRKNSFVVYPELAELFISLHEEKSAVELEYAVRDAMSHIRETILEWSEEKFEEIRNEGIPGPGSEQLELFECWKQIRMKTCDFNFSK